MNLEESWKEFRNIILGMGIVYAPGLILIYFLRIDYASELVTIGAALLLCVLALLTAVYFARTLPERVLIWVGGMGYVLTIVMVFLYAKWALAPIK